MPHRLVRATPAVGLCLILLVDGVQHVKTWPIPVMGLFDESAHLITAALIPGVRTEGGRQVGLALGAHWVGRRRHRSPTALCGREQIPCRRGPPPSHSLSVVLLLLAGAAIPALRRPLLGLAGGVILHIVRDMATGPGVPLLWPLIPENFFLPYPVYVA